MYEQWEQSKAQRNSYIKKKLKKLSVFMLPKNPKQIKTKEDVSSLQINEWLRQNRS